MIVMIQWGPSFKITLDIKENEGVPRSVVHLYGNCMKGDFREGGFRRWGTWSLNLIRGVAVVTTLLNSLCQLHLFCH